MFAIEIEGQTIYINPATVASIIKYDRDDIDTFCVKTTSGQLFSIPLDKLKEFQDAVDAGSGQGGGDEPLPYPDAKKLKETNENVTWLYNHRREGEEVDLSSLPQDDIFADEGNKK